MQVRKKVGKSRNTVFFPMVCGSGGSKSRYANVARSNFGSQNVHNTPFSDDLWKLRCRKSARRCGAKHVWKSKCAKHISVAALLEVAPSKKCTPLWREAHSEAKMYKTHKGRKHFWKLTCRKSARRCGAKQISKSKVQNEGYGRSGVVLRGRRKGLCTLSKVSKMACVGHLKRIWKHK